MQRIFLNHILKRTDVVIFNSHNTSADLARIYPFTANKTKTIHLGLGSGFFPDERTDFLEEYEIDSPYFVYVGTIEPCKNLILLLDAYEQFRESSTVRVMLVIVDQNGWKSEAFLNV